jgi:flagellar L-ring protein precursor FlgH
VRRIRIVMLLGIVGLFVWLSSVGNAEADSIWERRNPYFAHMMTDTKARRRGDVVTIALNETTTFDGREDRKLQKQTNLAMNSNLSGNFNSGKLTTRSFSGAFTGATTSNRELDGTSNYTSSRALIDQISVQVIEVLPNGALVIEGFRTRVVAGEERTIRVSGVVRPEDIGASNIVLSQFVANFTVEYMGKGPESSYMNNGWLGKIMNHVWPF